jgi:3-deoxy-D-manno-octulosonate 8-phosphate phosphatase KdsC-like HAD superfamily phosphatase
MQVIKDESDYILSSSGGQGAVREVAEIILFSKDEFN